jgi:hypothetical protein
VRRRFLLNGLIKGMRRLPPEFVTGIPHPLVILNLFQNNEPRSHVILKQVQDDEPWEVSVTGGIFGSELKFNQCVMPYEEGDC